MKFSESFILKLKSLCDISIIFSHYVDLKSVGVGKRCCCPFHLEKTPSCFIYENTQSFYCFGCNVGGDVITFIEKIENLNYIEAVKFLANKVGLELPREDSDDVLVKRKANIYKMNKIAAKHFHRNLATIRGRSGLSYLKSRGLNSSVTLKFGLGFAVDEWTNLVDFLKLEGFTQQEILEAGLAVKSKSGKLIDKFRNRLIFPIINYSGDVIGFGGRLLSGCGPKYLNSNETLVFKKGFELYGLNFLNKSQNFTTLILCEGYMDVVSLHKFGFSNCVATLGTSLTKNQVLLMSRFCRNVVLAYDSDSAGVKAGVRAINLLESAGLKVKILKLKGAKDPDEFLNKYGGLRFSNALDSAVSFEGLIFKNVKENFEKAGVDEQRNLIHKFCEHIAVMKDLVKRDVYIRKLCFELKLSRNVVLNHVKFIMKKKQANFKKKNFKFLNSYKQNYNHEFENRPYFTSDLSNLGYEKIQEFILRCVFFFPQKFDFLVSKLSEENFLSKFYKKIFICFVKLKKSNLTFNLSNMRGLLDDYEYSNFSRLINSDFFNSSDDLKFVFDEQMFNNSIYKLQSVKLKNKDFISKMSAHELELIRLEKAKIK